MEPEILTAINLGDGAATPVQPRQQPQYQQQQQTPLRPPGVAMVSPAAMRPAPAPLPRPVAPVQLTPQQQAQLQV